MREIFKIAISTTYDELIPQSIYIISTAKKEILQPLLDDAYFCTAISTILGETENISNSLIGRISTIALSLLTAFPNDAAHICGFLFHLFPYCYNPSVFNLFDILCSPRPNRQTVQRWLIEMGFMEFLMRELSSFDYSYHPAFQTESNDLIQLSSENSKHSSNILNILPLQDEKYEKAYTIYRLLYRCTTSTNFEGFVSSEQLINAIFQHFDPEPFYVSSQRWRLINGMCNSVTASNMEPFVEQAISLICQPIQEIHECHNYALQFLNQMLSFFDHTFMIMHDNKLPVILMGLMTQFQQCNFFHLTITQWISIAMHNRILAKEIALVYPTFLVSPENYQNPTLRPHIMNIIGLIQECSKTNETVKYILQSFPEYIHFTRTKYPNYIDLQEAEYGGKIGNRFSQFFQKYFGSNEENSLNQLTEL